jgi:hypothetical protein
MKTGDMEGLLAKYSSETCASAHGGSLVRALCMLLIGGLYLLWRKVFNCRTLWLTS